MPLHVPSLAKKLQCLYQRHERVNTHELLAEHLGIAPNNISIWINGNEVRARDLVPNRHIKRITDLFEVPVECLEIDSLEEFKALLHSSPFRDGPWPQLLARAATSDAIHLVRQEHRLELEAQSRGLIADDIREYLGLKEGSQVDFEYTVNGQVVLLPVKSLSKRKKGGSRFAALRSTGRRLAMSTDEYMNLIRGYDRDEDDPGFKNLK